MLRVSSQLPRCRVETALAFEHPLAAPADTEASAVSACSSGRGPTARLPSNVTGVLLAAWPSSACTPASTDTFGTIDTDARGAVGGGAVDVTLCGLDANVIATPSLWSRVRLA